MTALRPIYTDNLMHDLKAERFFKPEMVNDMNEVGDGAVKTFPLRGIKDYLETISAMSCEATRFSKTDDLPARAKVKF
jgi:hypothetical protein